MTPPMTPTPPRIVELGKRPIIDYVTKDYAGFRDGMLAQIPLLLPSWTDRSESDFGVALIELFAYVADILSYYQDRVANEAYLGTASQRRSVQELLRLIDYQIDPGLAASVVLHLDVSADVSVGGASLPYRTKTAGLPGEPDRIFEVTRPFSLRQRNNAIALGGALLTAGTSEVQVPSSSHALGAGDLVYLEETLATPPRTRRSRLLRLVAVRNVAAGIDALAWLPPLEEPFHPASTVLRGNNVVATHGQTVPDEPVQVGDGTPAQRLTLTRRPVTHLLAPPGGRRRSRPELEVRVDGVPWTAVDNLVYSGPFDTHYVVTIDENDALTLRFGTGQRGAVVPAGASVKALYRVGLGSLGNTGPGSITVPVSVVAQVETVTNPFAAEGGADRESVEEAKIAGPGSVITQQRAVTLGDYEMLARGFAGVGKARARVGLRGGYKVVQMFIAPENPGTIPPPLPSADLKEALKQFLEGRMPINRMAGVDVLDPRYVAIDVTVELHLKADASGAAAERAAREVLERLLGFPAVELGGAVRVGDIYAALFPIPGLAFSRVRSLSAAGVPAPPGDRACEVADLALVENELPHRGQISVHVFGGGP
jgi:hypothetical protein